MTLNILDRHYERHHSFLMIPKIILLILLTVFAHANIPLLNEDIGQEIFHECMLFSIQKSTMSSTQAIFQVKKSFLNFKNFATKAAFALF